jgi:hypothetical protein
MVEHGLIPWMYYRWYRSFSLITLLCVWISCCVVRPICSATISRREKAPVTTLTITDRGAHGFSGGQSGKDVRKSLFQVGYGTRINSPFFLALQRSVVSAFQLHRIASRSDSIINKSRLFWSVRSTQAPTFLRHTIDNTKSSGSLLLIVVYAVPIGPGRCRLLNRQVFKLKSSFAMGIISRLPGWLYHAPNNVVRPGAPSLKGPSRAVLPGPT